MRVFSLQKIRKEKQQPVRQNHRATSQSPQKSAEQNALELRLEPYFMNQQRDACHNKDTETEIMRNIFQFQNGSDDADHKGCGDHDDEVAPENQYDCAEHGMLVKKGVCFLFCE